MNEIHPSKADRPRIPVPTEERADEKAWKLYCPKSIVTPTSWLAVLVFPIRLTGISLFFLKELAQCLREDIETSLRIMRVTKLRRALLEKASTRMIKAQLTISLSATGSKKAPKSDSTCQRLARNPSNQSVRAARTNIGATKYKYP